MSDVTATAERLLELGKRADARRRQLLNVLFAAAALDARIPLGIDEQTPDGTVQVPIRLAVALRRALEEVDD